MFAQRAVRFPRWRLELIFVNRGGLGGSSEAKVGAEDSSRALHLRHHSHRSRSYESDCGGAATSAVEVQALAPRPVVVICETAAGGDLVSRSPTLRPASGYLRLEAL